MATDAITTNEAPAAREFAADGTGARIADLIAAVATRLPEKAALVVTPDRVPVSYRDLIRLADDLAGQLKRGGLRPGDRVALRTASNAEFVVGSYDFLNAHAIWTWLGQIRLSRIFNGVS